MFLIFIFLVSNIVVKKLLIMKFHTGMDWETCMRVNSSNQPNRSHFTPHSLSHLPSI